MQQTKKLRKIYNWFSEVIMNNKKALIIGCGHVGSTAAYSLILKNLVQEIFLLDVNESLLFGAINDLRHSAVFQNIKVQKGSYKDLNAYDYIIITAGPSQTLSGGATRLNGLFKADQIIKNIAENFKSSDYKGYVILASNPLDLMTYAFWKYSGLSKKQIIGTGTLLDTIRYLAILAEKFDIPTGAISGLVLGEHGESSFVVGSKTTLFDKSLKQFLDERAISYDDFISDINKEVKKSGFDIVSTQGATYYGIGNTIATIIEALETEQERILPLSTIVMGEYNINELAISLPTKISQNGFEIITDYFLDNSEILELHHSSETIKSYLHQINL